MNGKEQRAPETVKTGFLGDAEGEFARRETAPFAGCSETAAATAASAEEAAAAAAAASASALAALAAAPLLKTFCVLLH